MKPIITSIVLAVGLALCISASSALAKENEENEHKITQSDVPAAVQKTIDAEAKGGKILRWEKEGDNYEAVIEKNGKQTGIKVNADGKVVSRHDESKEHKEKGEKY